MTSQWDLFCVSGGMGLRLCITRIGFKSRYDVVFLCNEGMEIYACMIFVAAKNDFTCYKLWTLMFPCMCIWDRWGQGMICMIMVP